MKSLLKIGALALMTCTVFGGTLLAKLDRSETLLAVVEFGPNSLDIHGIGTNRPAYGLSWNVYDRLVTFGKKQLADGSWMYDYTQIEPELAESWEFVEDGNAILFNIRKDATFHDGSPVTAEDARWSLERAMTVGGFPQFQLKAGSLVSAEQLEVVGEKVLKIHLVKQDKLFLPNLATPVAAIINSKKAKAHATKEDPWALDYLKTHTAAGGAYDIASWKPGQETVYVVNENWKNGPVPKIKKAVVRVVPSAASQLSLFRRGQADLLFNISPFYAKKLKEDQKFKVIGTLIENCMLSVDMNVTKAPFDNTLVRQAIAYAIPYDEIIQNVVYGRARALYGSDTSSGIDWPRATKYSAQLEKAKALMQEAGYPDGFSAELSIDQGWAQITEPMAILIQESVAKIGIDLSIAKVPGANWRGAMLKKEMPILINNFGGWHNYPEYFFFWAYHGQNALFNAMSYQNPALDALVDEARFTANPDTYAGAVDGFIDMAYEEVPRVPLYQPMLDVAMQPSVEGYQYWFHRQLDLRQIYKTK